MSGYGTIRKHIAKLTGEIPELADLDHYVNDLKASAEPKAKEVVRTVKVADDAVLHEVRSLRQEKINLEESLDQERKAYRGLHAKYVEYVRSLTFGVIVAETAMPNYIPSLTAETASLDFIKRPVPGLILVDRQGEDQPDGIRCQTYLCETIPDLMKQIKQCAGYVFIFACGGGTLTHYCMTTDRSSAIEQASIVEAAAEFMMRKISSH